jgi:hypothetical protein
LPHWTLQTKKEEIVVTADKSNSAGHACPEGVKFDDYRK